MFGWIITGGLLLRERAQEYVRIETISAIKHLRSWKNISRSDVTADKNIRNAAFEQINTYILNEL